MSSNNFDKLLNKLKCQYLCCYPLHCIAWQELPADITWEQQAMLIENTYQHPLNQQYAVKVAYQMNFLKRLIERLEKLSVEVHDSIYESYCAVQQQVAQDMTKKYAYKHYIIPAYNAQLTLRESKSFVAEGTTGLCSWQASLALADYLLHNQQLVHDKQVLELGAGTGLCGFVLAKCCKPARLLLTDGSIECVQLMAENIERNFTDADTRLHAVHLRWDQIATVTPIRADILLAADVVYDDSVFVDLLHAIDYVFNDAQNFTKMLLAATVRNEHTLQKFLDLLGSKQFCYEETPVIDLEHSHLYWDRTTPVKIFIITK